MRLKQYVLLALSLGILAANSSFAMSAREKSKLEKRIKQGLDEAAGPGDLGAVVADIERLGTVEPGTAEEFRREVAIKEQEFRAGELGEEVGEAQAAARRAQDAQAAG